MKSSRVDCKEIWRVYSGRRKVFRYERRGREGPGPKMNSPEENL